MDDYLAKPFDPRELALRIRTILRRAAPAVQTDPAKPNLEAECELLWLTIRQPGEAKAG